jgi:putative membrane protein
VERTPRPFRDNRPLQAMVAWLLGFWLLTAIAPFDRRDWLLENLLVFAYSALLMASYRRFAFSNLSYALFTLFMTLHLSGAHYTYAETPLGDWLMAWFDWQRNHYDRIVHFAYGLLLAYPFYELLRRAAGLSRGWARFLVLNAILAFSGFFEVLEAVIAMLVSPELGTAYLGTQGDVWDAQKDMGLALLGATLAMGLSALLEGGAKQESP